METQLNMKLQMNYCQKDNWAHLLKCWGAINLSYNIFDLWQSFFIFSSSHNIDKIFYLFQLCGWTIQEQHPFWRKTQSVVKFVAKNFHKTLQFQFTEVHFFWTRQQNQLSLIGYKTSVLEFDKNICDLFNWILPFAFSESNFLFQNIIDTLIKFCGGIFNFHSQGLKPVYIRYDKSQVMSQGKDTILKKQVLVEPNWLDLTRLFIKIHTLLKQHFP